MSPGRGSCGDTTELPAPPERALSPGGPLLASQSDRSAVLFSAGLGSRSKSVEINTATEVLLRT